MGKVVNFFRDNLRSLVNGMGDPLRDKSASTYYSWSPITPEQLVSSYKSSWIAKKVIDIPADDSLRKGRDWQADANDITAIEAEEKRLGYWPKVISAYKQARLFGGAAILIGTGESDLMKPLDPANVGKEGLKYLSILSRRYLTAGDEQTDITDPDFGTPTFYRLSSKDGRQIEIHPSRLVILKGAELLDDELMNPLKDGFGESVLQHVYTAMKSGDGAAQSVSTMLFEANVDVINIPNFMSSLAAPDYAERFNSRLSLAAAAKGINGMLVLDGEETYSRKQITFGSVPETLLALMQVVSGAADIPVTRFLGQSPAGMNSTGEGDMKNYYDRIQSVQNLELRPALEVLDACLVASALGRTDDAIFYVWAPLEQMNEKQVAEVGKLIAETADILTRTQIFTPDELRSSVSNTLIEAGVFPGLEEAMEETGDNWEEAFEPTPEEIEMQKAQIAATQAKAGQPPQPGKPIGDATPRTLYVRRNVLNGEAILAWARSQGFTSTLPEDDLHVTIVYSKVPVDWMKVGSAWEEEMRIPPGGARLIEKFGEGATVLLFNSNALRWRHEEAIAAGASSDYPEYQPHITISYEGAPADIEAIEPYTGPIILGPEIFEELNPNWKAEIVEA